MQMFEPDRKPKNSDYLNKTGLMKTKSSRFPTLNMSTNHVYNPFLIFSPDHLDGMLKIDSNLVLHNLKETFIFTHSTHTKTCINLFTQLYALFNRPSTLHVLTCMVNTVHDLNSRFFHHTPFVVPQETQQLCHTTRNETKGFFLSCTSCVTIDNLLGRLQDSVYHTHSITVECMLLVKTIQYYFHNVIQLSLTVVQQLLNGSEVEIPDDLLLAKFENELDKLDLCRNRLDHLVQVQKLPQNISVFNPYNSSLCNVTFKLDIFLQSYTILLNVLRCKENTLPTALKHLQDVDVSLFLQYTLNTDIIHAENEEKEVEEEEEEEGGGDEEEIKGEQDCICITNVSENCYFELDGRLMIMVENLKHKLLKHVLGNPKWESIVHPLDERDKKRIKLMHSENVPTYVHRAKKCVDYDSKEDYKLPIYAKTKQKGHQNTTHYFFKLPDGRTPFIDYLDLFCMRPCLAATHDIKEKLIDYLQSIIYLPSCDKPAYLTLRSFYSDIMRPLYNIASTGRDCRMFYTYSFQDEQIVALTQGQEKDAVPCCLGETVHTVSFDDPKSNPHKTFMFNLLFS